MVESQLIWTAVELNGEISGAPLSRVVVEVREDERR